MAKPLVSTETIYATALRLLDEEGAEALSARNLAAALACSTRTLYQQVGKREELVRQLLDHYFSTVSLEFKRQATWQQSAAHWAQAMRSALLLHPNLTRLMTIENRGAIVDYVNPLLRVLLEQGFDEELALRSSRVLVHLVIGLTLSEIDTPPIAIRRRRRSKQEVQFEDLVITRSGKGRSDSFQDTPEVFANALQWTIAGIERERATVG